MLGQTIPLGIDINSPVSWFMIGIAVVVIALTISTRRGNIRPGLRTPAVPPDARADVGGRWSAAQARFADDPRAGCAYACAVVAELVRDAKLTAAERERFDAQLRAGRATAARTDASAAELRTAFAELRAVYGALITSPSSNERS